MRIIADAALPNATEVFAKYGEVVELPGRQIASADLRGADALIIRSVTQVNAELLTGATELKFVGTATAGYDHVDTALLAERGIAFTAAPGSNRESVGDYVLSALLVLAQRHQLDLSAMTLGVVGCGNTGSQVIARARALGMRTVLRDPPRAQRGEREYGASLEEVLACDVVTCHVPLNRDAADPLCTFHLIGARELAALREGAILINASRGPVVDNAALLDILTRRPDLKAWLDVFEGEPELKVPDLIPRLEGATPHIAGYSYESKRRATVMLAASMAKMLGVPAPDPYVMPAAEISAVTLGRSGMPDRDLLSRLVFGVYDVRRDDAIFRRSYTGRQSFDAMRRDYRERRELSSVTLHGVSPEARAIYAGLSFTIA